jgi:hypothetical protein
MLNNLLAVFWFWSLVAYGHPVFTSAWVLLSCIFVQYGAWWPQFDKAFVYWLAPLPAFAACLVPLMFVVDL